MGGLFVAAFAAELLVRHAAFGQSELAQRLAPWFRESWRYAPPDTDEYWIIEARMSGTHARPSSVDSLLGWTGEKVAPGTYANVREPAPEGKRLVLLYGDSFASCTTPPEDCFEGLLESSARGAELYLLNFGVGGYGLDQICLMLHETVGRFAAREPMVVIGVLVEDDLDRMLLSRRPWPKPRFELRAGELELYPPDPEELDRPPSQAASGIWSYAWRRIAYGSRLLPDSWRARLEQRPARTRRKRELARALLERAHQELEALGTEHLVLLFHGQKALAQESFGWQERFLEETLEELGIRWVSSRRWLEADARASGRPLDAYFDQETEGHPSRLGNEVVLRALLDQLE